MILDKRVCHKKTQRELKEEKLDKNNLCDFRKVGLKILVNNVRGYVSKRESFQAILAREEIDIACICETFMSGTKFPEIVGYTTYFRNRSKRSGGGIAVLIRDEVARYAVKVDVGPLENEFMLVKFTNCSPNLVIAIYYGNQVKVGVDQIKLHLSQLLEAVQKQIDLGCNIQLVGVTSIYRSVMK